MQLQARWLAPGPAGCGPVRAGVRRAVPAAPCVRARASLPGSPRGGSPASTIKEQRQGTRALTLAPTAKSSAPPPADAASSAGADADAGAPSATPAAAPAGAALGAWWDALPSRYKVLLGAFMSFVICNMVRGGVGSAIGVAAPGRAGAPSVHEERGRGSGCARA
jgi:hypothetical protein